MATGTIPFSNPAGNNQMSPLSKMSMPGAGMPSKNPIPGSPTVAGAPQKGGATPYAVPSTVTSGLQPAAPGAVQPANSAQNGFITNSQDAGQNALQKQLTDIYGQGTGGSLFSLLNSMSGTDSQVLQEYIQSLQPQQKQAQAGVNAALGAGGVSANSSVAALADSNLQSNEFSAIAGQSANLTKSQEDLTAQVLEGTEGASAKEVATSDWSIFGDVMNSVSQDAGAFVGAATGMGALGSIIPGSGGGSPTGSAIASLTGPGGSGSGISVDNSDLYNPPELSW
jgi:hypothetical protein